MKEGGIPMTKAKLKDLQEAAIEAVSTDKASDKIDALSRAFKLFSEETKRLEIAHAQLTKDFQVVNVELEQANRRLGQKLLELDTSTSYLKNILINMSQGLLFINKSSIVTTYNKSAEAILGRAAVEVLFQPFSQSFDDKLFGFSIQEALTTKQVPALSLVSVRGSHPLELEVDARYVTKKEGTESSKRIDETLDFTEGLIILVRNVTEEHRLKLIADRNDRLKELGEMAAMVAHEIRNPLGGIKGFASLLKRDLVAQPELQQMAAYIVEGTDALNRLVTNVLNYARPVQLLVSQVDLIKLLEDVRERVLIDEGLSKEIHININCELDSCILALDGQLIQSALLNLIVNAIEAMHNVGTVNLWLVQDHGHAILKISDTGVGIEAENLARIFSPFFTTKPHGNGFGLSEVYKVIQAHAGTIEVASTKGKGTTFTLKFPIRSAS